MKFKLDENFGTRTQRLFTASGHDVQTVLDESLGGASDQELFQVCQSEARCLVTFDLDFANVLRFPPANSAGIVIIRMPKNPTLATLESLVKQFLFALEVTPIAGKLWIVEMGRIRIHQSSED